MNILNKPTETTWKNTDYGIWTKNPLAKAENKTNNAGIEILNANLPETHLEQEVLKASSSGDTLSTRSSSPSDDGSEYSPKIPGCFEKIISYFSRKNH